MGVKSTDGTTSAFGAATMASMLSSLEDDTDAWMAVLPQSQLHALAHELGCRLVEISRIYQARKDNLEEHNTGVDYRYFGLGETATERSLENAYKRLARQMHPDKNGGTEEAKQQFQELRQRYDRIRQKFSDGSRSRAADDDVTRDPSVD